MYFPTAEIEVSPFVPPLVAFVVSFFTSMGGISGAFLLLPFQMTFLGYTNTSVSATNQLYNVFSNPGGVFRYYREKRMLWPLSWIVMAGAVPGVVIGGLVRINWLAACPAFQAVRGARAARHRPGDDPRPVRLDAFQARPKIRTISSQALCRGRGAEPVPRILHI